MSAHGNEDELVAQFRDVTGANTERAKFYMEASGWDLSVAIAGFYEGDQSDQEIEPEDVSKILNTTPAGDPDAPPPPKSNASNVPKSGSNPPSAPAPRVLPMGMATLDSLRQQEEDSSDEDENGQAFFAGGSVTSGQQVLGPPKKKDEFIRDLFEKAKEHGATSEDPFAPGKPASAFSGAGYKLGDMAGGSAAVPTPTSTGSANSGPQEREVTLRLWRTGFTIDDGQLRLYSDPDNLALLDSIKRGELPQELVRSHPGQEVQLAMEDHRHEQYEPPKAPRNPFSGQGHTLGSPTPTVVSSVVSTNSSDNTTHEALARHLINLSESEPTTNLQFRLADGSRLVARFNHTHRISDLHNFINTARPQYSSVNYILTLFPNRDLTDMEVTLKDANILNAALTQKVKSSA